MPASPSVRRTTGRARLRSWTSRRTQWLSVVTTRNSVRACSTALEASSVTNRVAVSASSGRCHPAMTSATRRRASVTLSSRGGSTTSWDSGTAGW